MLFEFDYQSDRHCTKTHAAGRVCLSSLITSQIDTAPKLFFGQLSMSSRLITSQIDTAPKQDRVWDVLLAVLSAWLGAKFTAREEDKRVRKRAKHFRP